MNTKEYTILVYKDIDEKNKKKIVTAFSNKEHLEKFNGVIVHEYIEAEDYFSVLAEDLTNPIIDDILSNNNIIGSFKKKITLPFEMVEEMRKRHKCTTQKTLEHCANFGKR